jgi:branched-chain amino acid transport system substrate-binding protein
MSILGVFFLVGCSTAPVNQVAPTSSDSSNNQDTTPIKVGVIAPLAGSAAVYGEDAARAYDYIIDKVNAAGGVNGRQIELIYENGACGGKEATNAVQKLINIDGVEVILG